jgi:hypothetical protein
MNCPHCRSSRIHGPVYGNRSGRRSATMLCRSCQQPFDAYEMFGRADALRAA